MSKLMRALLKQATTTDVDIADTAIQVGGAHS
jgi:hypothetical protein